MTLSGLISHRFSGRQMGYVGNNGSIDTSYVNAIANRTANQGSGAFNNGASSSTSFADFDLAYDSVTSYAQGSAGGMYVVQAGDTLQGIAAGLWGDASLWYKLAEINGLSAESVLIEGLPLIIPVGVMRNENNSSTYQPYDPNEVIGNTAPTAVKPPAKKKCGGMGMMLLAVIAIVVTIYTAGAASGMIGALGGASGAGVGTAAAAGAAAGGLGSAALAGGAAALAGGGLGLSGAMAIAAGAIGGAIGSIVSQGVGVATNIQEKFSWNAVALAVIGGGVGGSGVGDVFGSQIVMSSKGCPAMMQRSKNASRS